MASHQTRKQEFSSSGQVAQTSQHREHGPLKNMDSSGVDRYAVQALPLRSEIQLHFRITVQTLLQIQNGPGIVQTVHWKQYEYALSRINIEKLQQQDQFSE